MRVIDCGPHRLHITWEHPLATATLEADLRDHSFTVHEVDRTMEGNAAAIDRAGASDPQGDD
jgi:hypothetical protein